MSFPAVVPGSGGADGFRIPTVHSEIGSSASNYEPMSWVGGNETTDLTPKFLHRQAGTGGLVLDTEQSQLRTSDGGLRRLLGLDEICLNPEFLICNEVDFSLKSLISGETDRNFVFAGCDQ